jgi:hypothetical protein
MAMLMLGLALEAVLGGLANRAVLLPDSLLAAVHTPLLAAFGFAVVAALAGGCAAWIVLERNRAPVIFLPGVAIVVALAIELSVFLLLYPALEPLTSPRPIALSAASITEPGDPIGLVSDRAMIGGLVYYGERRVTPLQTPEGIRRFVEEGGKVIVAKTRKLHRVEQVTPFEVVSRSRSGRREVSVIVPMPAAGATAPPSRDR